MNNVVTTVPSSGARPAAAVTVPIDTLPHASLAARLTLRLGLWLLLRSTAHLNRSPAARDAHRLGLCNERDRLAREHAAVAMSMLGSRVL
jgi:hypothetical protein